MNTTFHTWDYEMTQEAKILHVVQRMKILCQSSMLCTLGHLALQILWYLKYLWIYCGISINPQ